jgi:phospholipid N-methyltransferase
MGVGWQSGWLTSSMSGGRMIRSVLVGTALGVVAQRLREQTERLRMSGKDLEKLGNHSNDIIARKLLERLCLPGATFVDVGAHIGSVIDGVSRRSKPSALIAVEAIPAEAKALARRFPKVTIHECAVGEQEG